MKPFNLEKALAGDPVVTEDGRQVVEIFYSKSNLKQPVLALVAGSHEFEHFNKDGRFFANETCRKDLRMAPKMVKKWINIYRDDRGGYVVGGLLASLDEADRMAREAKLTFLKTVCIEIEE